MELFSDVVRQCRGVDVRILIPSVADHWMFRYVHDALAGAATVRAAWVPRTFDARSARVNERSPRSAFPHQVC